MKNYNLTDNCTEANIADKILTAILLGKWFWESESQYFSGNALYCNMRPGSTAHFNVEIIAWLVSISGATVEMTTDAEAYSGDITSMGQTDADGCCSDIISMGRKGCFGLMVRSVFHTQGTFLPTVMPGRQRLPPGLQTAGRPTANYM